MSAAEEMPREEGTVEEDGEDVELHTTRALGLSGLGQHYLLHTGILTAIEGHEGGRHVVGLMY